MAKDEKDDKDPGDGLTPYIVLEAIDQQDDPTKPTKTQTWKPVMDRGVLKIYRAKSADKAIDAHTGKGIVEDSKVKKGVWKAISKTAWAGVRETGAETVVFNRPVAEAFAE